MWFIAEVLQILRRLDTRTVNIMEALDTLAADESAESAKLDAYIAATNDLLTALRSEQLSPDAQAKVDALAAAIQADTAKLEPPTA